MPLNWARDVGVPADEALRKTDFDVYKKAVDAAFATPGMTGFNVEGAWRPHPDDVRSMNKKPHSENTGSKHISSRALDINRIQFTDEDGDPAEFEINNSSDEGGPQYVPKKAQPTKDGKQKYATVNRRSDIYQNFYDRISGDRSELGEIYDPWSVWRVGQTVRDNEPERLSDKDNDYLHRNHLHIYVKPQGKK